MSTVQKTRALFRQTKVIYNAVDGLYEVYYRKLFFWKFYMAYRNEQPNAEKQAINLAKTLLLTAEIYRSDRV